MGTADEQQSDSSYGGCEQRSDLCIMYRAVGRNLHRPIVYHNMTHPVMFCFRRGVLAFHLQLFTSYRQTDDKRYLPDYTVLI